MKLLITQFSKKEARLIINKLCRLYLFAKEVSRRILLFLIKVTKKDEKLLFYENGVYNKLYFYTSLQSSRSIAFITNTINIKNSGLQCTPNEKIDYYQTSDLKEVPHKIKFGPDYCCLKYK